MSEAVEPDAINVRCPVGFCYSLPGVRCCDPEGYAMPSCHGERERAARLEAGAFTITRTGEAFSFASNKFRVEYPDGYVGSLWSPPWHEMEPDEEFRAAEAMARRLYAEGRHREQS